MTISSTTRTAGPFTGTGLVSTFSFTFKVFQASDLLVVRQTISTGAQTTFVLNTDYTVSLNVDQDSNPGGSITLVAGALAATYTLVITSSIANLQPTILTNQGGFYPEVINDSLDRATIQIQQVATKSGRELSAPLVDGAVNMVLPSARNRASKFLYFGASGEPMAAAGTNTGNNTSPGNLTLTANNAGSNTARDVIFYDNTTETMRIDGNGTDSRLGIGTAVPSTKVQLDVTSTTLDGLRVNNAASAAYCSIYAVGTVGTGTLTPYSCVLEGVPASTGNTYISSYNNNLAFTTGSSRLERMRISSAGLVGIGTASPAYLLTLSGGSGLSGFATDGTVGQAFAYASSTLAYAGTTSGHPYALITGNTEKMRILSAGQVCIGIGTLLANTNRVNIAYTGAGTEYGIGLRPGTAGTSTAMSFENSSAAQVGRIDVTASTTAYVTSSDYRLKTNVVAMTGALDKVDALNPCKYTWIADASDGEGFIAHELQSVIPHAVTGTKDDVDEHGNIRPQGVDHSRVVPTLTAAIKELKAIVEAQAARIAALEARA
jgi:hypothetical protein